MAALGPAKAAYKLLLASQAADREHGPESREAAGAANDMGVAFFLQDNARSSAEAFGRVLAAAESEDGGAGGPGLRGPLVNLGISLIELDSHAQALALFRRAFAVEEAGPGPESPEAVGIRILVGTTLSATGEYGEALEVLDAAAEISRRTLGDGHKFTLSAEDEAAVALLNTEEYGRAQERHRANLEAAEKAMDASHPFLILPLTHLAEALSRAPAGERPLTEVRGEVVALLRRAYEVSAKSFGKGSRHTIWLASNLGLAMAERGDQAGGERIIRKAQADLARTVNQSHPYVRSVKKALVRVQSMRNAPRGR
jgi:tetratricopeptide (TPR) repeat protein